MKSFVRFLLFVVILTLVVVGLYEIRDGKFNLWGTSADAKSQQVEKDRESYQPVEREVIDPSDVNILAALDAQYTKLIEAVVPSVVSISTEQIIRNRNVHPLELLLNPRYRPSKRSGSLGSGVIVSENGHILTNHHVVNGMDKIVIRFSDGEEKEARVLGSDSVTDIAVLKVDAKDLKALPFGDSDEVRVGQMVFAVGNPFGLEETVTQGIVSAVGRQTMDHSTNEFIQTDTAINPGNSGGPLLNLRGEIIGLNNHIFSGSGGYQGIGFAIPSNLAEEVMRRLIQDGHIERGYLGVEMTPLTSQLAAELKYKGDGGVVIAGVMPGSPAQRAGIEVGDVVVEVEGKTIRNMRQLRGQVLAKSVGEEMNVKAVRAGQEEKFVVTIAAIPDKGLSAIMQDTQESQGNSEETVESGPLKGMEVAELLPVHRKEFGIPDAVRGVLVVKPPTVAGGAQLLRPGDVIEEIDRSPVHTVSDFQKIARRLDPEEGHLFFVCRQQTRSFVMLTPG